MSSDEEKKAIEILKDNIKSLEGPTPFKHTNYEKVQAIETLLTAYEKEKEKNKEAKNLLIDMVNQFAYEDNKHERLYTGGLSTLEDAFYLLDIDEGIKREDLWKLKEE